MVLEISSLGNANKALDLLSNLRSSFSASSSKSDNGFGPAVTVSLGNTGRFTSIRFADERGKLTARFALAKANADTQSDLDAVIARQSSEGKGSLRAVASKQNNGRSIEARDPDREGGLGSRNDDDGGVLVNEDGVRIRAALKQPDSGTVVKIKIESITAVDPTTTTSSFSGTSNNTAPATTSLNTGTASTTTSSTSSSASVSASTSTSSTSASVSVSTSTAPVSSTTSTSSTSSSASSSTSTSYVQAQAAYSSSTSSASSTSSTSTVTVVSLAPTPVDSAPVQESDAAKKAKKNKDKKPNSNGNGNANGHNKVKKK